MNKIRKYTHHYIHRKLADLFYGGDCSDIELCNNEFHKPNEQAMFCPYYVRLEGILGADWGVIINPSSKWFGQLVFEHDWCGCSHGFHSVGNQKIDEWVK